MFGSKVEIRWNRTESLVSINQFGHPAGFVDETVGGDWWQTVTHSTGIMIKRIAINGLNRPFAEMPL